MVQLSLLSESQRSLFRNASASQWSNSGWGGGGANFPQLGPFHGLHTRKQACTSRTDHRNAGMQAGRQLSIGLTLWQNGQNASLTKSSERRSSRLILHAVWGRPVVLYYPSCRVNLDSKHRELSVSPIGGRPYDEGIRYLISASSSMHVSIAVDVKLPLAYYTFIHSSAFPWRPTATVDRRGSDSLMQ